MIRVPAPAPGHPRQTRRRSGRLRPRVAAATAAALAAVLLVGCTASGADEPAALVWSDEFDGDAGAPPSTGRWRILTGAGGWGNDELQAYTSEADNVALDGEGHLRIRALAEPTLDAEGRPAAYTSARIESLQAFTYGRIEARIKVPAGQGLWSAFWTLGQDHESVGWPRSGEIDVLETFGDTRDLHANAHAASREPADGGRWQALGTTTLDEPLADGWHVYGVDWTGDALVFTLDGTEHHRILRADLSGEQRWPFDGPQVLLLNLAVGGSWPGPPDDSTVFPAELLVDWVRVHAD
ncbi:beta-glucanase (GH16 family) [Mumia flava]|uniref:Beta-glucanase (GH16 family) n=1 Tax=Mumia flava TaxID=1348852 RepID=A0A2M9BK60_9ACTN|nr:beta-glucanase (GH16 family) [Mumia flava]